MEREIETVALDVFGHPQPDEHVDEPEDNQRHDAVVDEHHADTESLVDDLNCIALKQTSRTAVLLDSKHAGEQRACSTPDRMHAECIQRVIIAEHRLEAGAAPIAYDAGRYADPECAERADKARSWRDGDETCHRTGADADHGRLALEDPLDDHPGEARRSSGGVGD